MHLAHCECASMHNSSLFCSNTRSIDTLAAWLTFHRHFPRPPKTFIVGFFPYINKVTSLSALVRASGEKYFSLKPSGYPAAVNQLLLSAFIWVHYILKKAVKRTDRQKSYNQHSNWMTAMKGSAFLTDYWRKLANCEQNWPFSQLQFFCFIIDSTRYLVLTAEDIASFWRPISYHKWLKRELTRWHFYVAQTGGNMLSTRSPSRLFKNRDVYHEFQWVKTDDVRSVIHQEVWLRRELGG